MNFPIIRPAKLSDLNALIQFAQDSGYGITSLPRNLSLLEKKLEESEKAFSSSENKSKPGTYQFCLEWGGDVIGTSAIISRIGMHEPFFAYHLLYEPLKSAYLGVNRHIPVLHFVQARKKPTEIGSLFLSQAHRRHHFGKLLSLSRFLFISSFRSWFSTTVIAELRGVNENGYSPFWDSIGRPFFQMDFASADLLRTEHHSCIEELFPKHPIYVELLSKEVQSVIGMTHSQTLPAKILLEKQGFQISHYVDLFDAGPHVFANTEEIDAVRRAKHTTLKEVHTRLSQPQEAIISNADLDFRATFALISLSEGQVIVQPKSLPALHLEVGSSLRYYLL